MKGDKIVFGENGKPDRFYLDGTEVPEAEFRARHPDQEIGDGSALLGFKPIHSDALGYHPSQIAEAHEYLAKKGVDCEIDSKGRPVFTSRQQRAKFLKATGYFDRDAGYGDPADGSFRDHVEPKKTEMYRGE